MEKAQKSPALTMSPGRLYFLKKSASNASHTSRDEVPQNSYQTSFEVTKEEDSPVSGSGFGGSFAWLPNLLSGRSSYQSEQQKPRKVPVKIEPKVFFANERTFLAWLHMAVTLATISVAIVALAEHNEWSQLYGLFLMPVSIAFCIYALYMYTKRAGMIRRKEPGPYDDQYGPVALASLLGLAVILNFFVKLIDLAT